MLHSGRFFFVVLLALLALVAARVDVVERDGVSAAAVLGASFGAAQGATVEIDLVTEVGKDGELTHLGWMHIVLLNEYQYNLASRLTIDSLCTAPSQMRVEFNGNITVTRELPLQDRYRVVILNCDPLFQNEELKISGTITWVNANGLFISLEDVPLIFLYDVFARITGAAIFLLLVSIIRNGITPIHAILLFLVLAKEAQYILQLIFYKSMANSGEILSGLSTAASWLLITSSTVLLALLLLISMGWRVARRRMRRRDRQLFWGSVLMYGGFTLAVEFCNGPQFLCSLDVLCLNVAKFVATFAMMVSVNHNVAKLRRLYSENYYLHPFTYMEPEETHRRALFQRRISALLSLRRLFVTYLLLPVVYILFSFTLLSWEDDWVDELVAEGLHLSVLLAVCWVFRLESEVVLRYPLCGGRRSQDQEDAAQVVELGGAEEDDDEEEEGGDGNSEEEGDEADEMEADELDDADDVEDEERAETSEEERADRVRRRAVQDAVNTSPAAMAMMPEEDEW